MKILVTGATGFLGTHLCSALEANGHEIVRLNSKHADLTVARQHRRAFNRAHQFYQPGEAAAHRIGCCIVAVRSMFAKPRYRRDGDWDELHQLLQSVGWDDLAKLHYLPTSHGCTNRLLLLPVLVAITASRGMQPSRMLWQEGRRT